MNQTNTENNNDAPVDPFKPELLQETQGSTYGQDDLQEELEISTEQAEEASGLDFDVFDSKELVDLPPGVWAATLNDTYRHPLTGEVYDNTRLLADPEILERPEEERNHALIHEGVHGHYFSGEQERPVQEAGIYGEDAKKLYSFLNSGDEELVEGATEFLTHMLDPESEKVGKMFYPRQLEAVEQELDADTELVEDIRGLKHELLDHYTEVYDVEVDSGVYREQGEFAGLEYDITIMADGAEAYGEEVVNEYLGEIANYMKDGVYGLEEGGLAEDNSINWSGWDEKLEYTEGM